MYVIKCNALSLLSLTIMVVKYIGVANSNLVRGIYENLTMLGLNFIDTLNVFLYLFRYITKPTDLEVVIKKIFTILEVVI